MWAGASSICYPNASQIRFSNPFSAVSYHWSCEWHSIYFTCFVFSGSLKLCTWGYAWDFWLLQFVCVASIRSRDSIGPISFIKRSGQPGTVVVYCKCFLYSSSSNTNKRRHSISYVASDSTGLFLTALDDRCVQLQQQQEKNPAAAGKRKIVWRRGPISRTA